MKFQPVVHVELRLTIQREDTDPPLFTFTPPKRPRMLVDRIVFGAIDTYHNRLSSQLVRLYGRTLHNNGEPSPFERDEITTLDQVPDNVMAMWCDWRDQKFKVADAALAAVNDFERRREAKYEPVAPS